MPYYLVQGGTSLYKVSSTGTATAISIPSTVTLRSRRVRFAAIAKNVVMVNSPSRSLWIDEDLTVRTHTLRPPSFAPILDGTAGGTLSGIFKVRVSFYLADAEGNIINESPLGPASDANPVIASKWLRCRGVPKSNETISGRRLYRTTTGPGEVYFPWFDIENNLEMTGVDDLSDAALILLPAPLNLVNPPGTMPGEECELITSYKNRIFLRGTQLVDRVFYSEDGSFYQFSGSNFFDVPPLNQDERGMTAFAARRDELGLLKRDVCWKLVGSSPDNWSLIKFAENIGCVSQDTVVVIRDVAYWLGEDGIYTWGPDGVVSITRERVHPWFTTDETFNRAAFDVAFAGWNPLLDTYDIFLPATGGTTINRWLSYSTTRKTWMGPHKTGAFTPSFSYAIEDTNDQLVPIICGTDGTLNQMNQTVGTDNGTAIDFDVDLAHLHMDAPDDLKFFGELAVRARVEAAGTLTITPYVGDLTATAQPAITMDLTTGRKRARILGTGRFLKLNFRNAENAQKLRLFGCEIPFHTIGRD